MVLSVARAFVLEMPALLQRKCPERDSFLHQRRWRHGLEELVRLSLQQLLHDSEQLVFVKLCGGNRSRRRHPTGTRGWRSWNEEMGRRGPLVDDLAYRDMEGRTRGLRRRGRQRCQERAAKV